MERDRPAFAMYHVVVHEHVAHAAAGLGADGDAHPCTQHVAAHSHVVRHILGEGGARERREARLDRHVVVAARDVALLDEHMAARVRVDAVRVWRVQRRANPHMVDVDVFGVDGMEGPKGRVFESEAGYLNARTVVQLDNVRSTCTQSRPPAPPPWALSIERPGATDGHPHGIDCHEQSLVA
eukprot:6172575-Pleurochrysis_carterae.AAC.4